CGFGWARKFACCCLICCACCLTCCTFCGSAFFVPPVTLACAFCWPVAGTDGAALAVAAAGVALTAPVAAAGVVAGVADVFAACPFIPFLGCSAPGVAPPAA